MLCCQWLSLVLVLATNVVACTDSSCPRPKEPNSVPSQCQARAWVRAPDMVPGEVIAGDVKIKLSGPCTDAKSYVLGLRYKERVFWQSWREDAPKWEDDWWPYENKDSWSMHEEERIAFEIKSPLTVAGGTDTLSRNFTTRFGVLVPNTNYPPGLDCRRGCTYDWGVTDIISGESIYEYFVEIGFSNGTTSEIPAGLTSFTPFYLSTENNAPSANVSLSSTHSGSNMKPSVDGLRSNYTVEVSFPEGAHVYRNSSVDFTAIVHRTGYTNRTDIPVELCACLTNDFKWHSQELQNKSQPSPSFVRALVPSIVTRQHSPRSPCREISFAATPASLAHESHIISTSSEPLSLSLYVEHDDVLDFSTYYQKLGHLVRLDLFIAPDPSEPCENESEELQWEELRWEEQILDADELDWVPWMPTQTPPSPRTLSGNTNVLSVIAMQKQGPVRLMPVHYLSDQARQPVFVHSSDIADLRLMLPEERDLIAPLTQPSIKVFSKGEEIAHRYRTGGDWQYPIYVGDTWVKKVLPMITKDQGESHTVDHLLVVQ
ncbi:hypothetical protein BDR06DRAFT_486880 [Suillus hirtellus]|nr:hypothetical protein BDR06DRAFT_486880 [Suillus hirtellus]